jgi:hypothetical protein
MTRNVLRVAGYAIGGYFSFFLANHWFAGSDAAFLSLLVLVGLFGEVAFPVLAPAVLPGSLVCEKPLVECPKRRACLAVAAAAMVTFGLFLLHGAMCLKANCNP